MRTQVVQNTTAADKVRVRNQSCPHEEATMNRPYVHPNVLFAVKSEYCSYAHESSSVFGSPYQGGRKDHTS